MQRLIINADDFGLTPGVNRAIRELHIAGVLTSATLMANGAAFDDAVSIALANPSLGVGCHVVLTDGSPISDPRSIPSLIDFNSSTPTLYPTLGRFLPALLRGHITAANIEREATAQIRRIQSAGLHITHLDTHKHTHLFPAVLRPLIRAAVACGVHAIRNPFEPAWSCAATPGSYLRRIQVSLLGSMRGSFERTPHPATTQGSIGISATGDLNATTLRALLAILPDGDWELVCHPGYVDAGLSAVRTRLRTQRETELAALLQEVPRALAANKNLSLIHFGQLASSPR